MKTAKLCMAMTTMLIASQGIAAAQISTSVSNQVDALTRPCTSLAVASAELPEASAKAVAIASLDPCYETLNNLDKFERENGSALSIDERNYFYYVGGNVVFITAAAEIMKNNGLLNQKICSQVKAAESAWGNVVVNPGSPLDISMKTNDLRSVLLPACSQAQ